MTEDIKRSAAIVHADPQAIAQIQKDALENVNRVVSHVRAVQMCMEAVMKPGVHYGVIPGTEKRDPKTGKDVSKPTLFQPGADVLMLLFRLRARYSHRFRERATFIGVRSRCRLIHIPTGVEWGEGFGAANSSEDKYQNQATQRLCPQCKQPSIRRSKARPGENPDSKGWYCWDRLGGCGSEFVKDDPAISGSLGVLIGAKVWSMENTILKIANKRSRVAGVLNTTAASDCFDQDLEDLEGTAEGMREAAEGKHDEGDGGQRRPGAAGNGTSTNNGKIGMVERAALNSALSALGIKAEGTGRDEWVAAATEGKFKAVSDLPNALAKELTAAAQEKFKAGGSVPPAATAPATATNGNGGSAGAKGGK